MAKPFLRAVLLVLWVAFFLPTFGWSEDADQVFPDPGLRTVAVWDFENGTVAGLGDAKEVDYLVRTLPEMIVSKLVGTAEDVKVVERVHLREALEELKLGSSEMTDQKAKLQLGRLSGARFMIFGDFMVMGTMVQIAVRVVNVETSLMVFVDNQNGPLSSMGGMANTLAGNVARSFAAGTPSTTAFAWKQDMTLWKRQDEGLKLIDQRRYDDAIKVFKGILKDRPDFLPAQRQIQMAKLGDDYKNGLGFMASGKYKEAVEAFKRVLKQNPAFKPARDHLRKALQQKRQAA